MKTYFDIQGDGGSNVLEQVAAQQDAIGTSLAGVKHVLAVGSGKGGVGKSTATMALGHALRRRGLEVAILDADFNGPCQAQMAGLSHAPWVPGPDGLDFPRRADGLGVVSFGSFLAQAQDVELASVAKGDEFVWRATKEFATLGQLIATIAWGSLDVLLVDLPPGAERAFHYAGFFGPRASFVVVTIPTEIARGVVARSISALRRADARVLGYIENMAGYFHRDTGEVLPLFPTSNTTVFDVPRLGVLPFDPALATACDEGWSEQAAPELPGLDDLTDQVLAALETS